MEQKNSAFLGKQFGKLTVLDYWKNEKGHWKCLCQCDCGNKKEVYWVNLNSGRTRSCGCLNKNKPINDLTGRHFGRLLVIRVTEERIGASMVWECQCDCGQICRVSSRNLMRGDTKSCGCIRREKGDLAGKRFGRLLALFPTQYKKNGVVLWQCRCDCGEECQVSAGNLKSGHTRSCGCFRREQMHKRMHDLTGQHFGYLTVLKATDQRQAGQVVWECQCICKNLVYTTKFMLTSGRAASCGCLKNHRKSINLETAPAQNAAEEYIAAAAERK